jgi:hypothetical protein
MEFLRIKFSETIKKIRLRNRKTLSCEEYSSLYVSHCYQVLERKSGTYARKLGLSDTKSEKIIIWSLLLRKQVQQNVSTLLPNPLQLTWLLVDEKKKFL